MPDGYTKLFSDIVDSSIWDEDLETRVVWVTLLALCNADGLVRGSVGWLAAKSRVSLEACSRSLAKFQSPDLQSRTPDNEGRRIEQLEDGWLILNYLMFRDRLSTNPVAVKTRDRVRKHRERYNALRNVTSVTPAQSASASEDVRKEGGTGETKSEKKRFVAPTIEEVKLFCSKAGIANSDGEWFFHKESGTGWLISGKPMKSWTHTLTAWKVAGYLPSQKNGRKNHFGRPNF